jgi:hypothetical protein
VNSVSKPISALTIFGGMAPELAPADLPAGPAVIAEDVDFDSVGAVRTRDGVISVYSFANSFQTSLANSGTASGTGVPWLNPNNITVGTPGTYASVTLNNTFFFGAAVNTGLSLTATVSTPSESGLFALCLITQQYDGGVNVPGTPSGWTVFDTTNAGAKAGIFLQSPAPTGTVSASSTLPPLQGGPPSPPYWIASLALFGQKANVTPAIVQQIQVASGLSIGIGTGSPPPFTKSFTSPNTAENTILIFINGPSVFHPGHDEPIGTVTASDTNGNNYTQIVNLANLFDPLDGIQQIVLVATGINAGPNTVTVNWTSGAITGLPSIEMYEISGLGGLPGNTLSNFLQGANFPFTIPPGVGVTGIELLVGGHQTSQDASTQLTVQMTGGGVANPPVTTFQLPSGDGVVTVGYPTDNWGIGGTTLTPAFINSNVLNFSIQASSNVLATFDIYSVAMRVFVTPPPQNFNYIKTFEETDGTTLNLALDNAGTFWQEDVYNNPGVLTAFYTLIEPGTFATSVTVDDREFIALSNLIAGTDMPRQYDGTNFNRLSQVGPGAPPTIGQASSVAFLTSVDVGGSPPGDTTYNGTFSPVIPVGTTVDISGWANTPNNGIFTVISCTSTNLVVNNPAGIPETGSGVVTFTGTANEIISITQHAPVKVRRLMIGNALGNSTVQGTTMTFFGEGKVPNTTTPSIGASLPGVEVGGTIVFTWDPIGGGTGDGGVWGTGATYSGTYTVTAVNTSQISAGSGDVPSEIVPCFTAVSTQAQTNAKTADFPAGGTQLGTYQSTVSTLTVANPIPFLGAGDNITIAGASDGGYDGSWNITDELNGGQMSITTTAIGPPATFNGSIVGANVAVYSYTPQTGQAIGWQSGVNYVLGDQIIDQHGFVQQVTTAGTSSGSIPNFSQTVGTPTTDAGGVVWTNENFPGTPGGAAFGLVTVNGATNGTTSSNNPLNVTNAQVTSATDTQFTVSVIAQNIPSGADLGATAVINGTIFTFDTTKLLANSTGGTILQQGGLASGTRQAVCLFLTEAGLLTQCSPPIQFNLSANEQAIICGQIPVGPSNVVARVIAFTEAGQQGVPGAFFYYIPEPVTTVSPFNANQQITYSSTVIPNNTQTTATFAFTDDILLAATEIDIQGANNFNQVELGSSLGVIEYSNRLMAWGVQSKITNLINYSFDGGVNGNVAAIVGDTTFSADFIQNVLANNVSSTYSFTSVQHCSGQVAVHGGSNGQTVSASFPSAVTAGNSILVGLNVFHYNSAPTVTDNQGNRYTPLVEVVDGEFTTYLFAASAVAGGAITLTVNSVGQQFNSFTMFVADEVQGAISTTVDRAATATGETNLFNTGTILTSNPNDVIISVITNATAAGVTPTVPSGFTLIAGQSVPQPNQLNGAVPVLAMAYKQVSATGAFTPTWSASVMDGLGITAAFRLTPAFAYGQPTLVKAFTKPVTSGNGVLVLVESYDYPGTLTVTDSQGNTYRLVSTSVNSLSVSTVWTTKATANGSLTITLSQSVQNSDSYMLSNFVEFSGLLVPITTDGVATNSGTFNSTFNTGEVITTGPVDLIVSTLWDTGGAISLPSGWSSLGTIEVPTVSSNPAQLNAGYFVSQTGGSYNANWTRTGNSISGNGSTVAFSLQPIIAPNVTNNAGAPLGWTSDPVFGAGGSVGPSPIFGSAYIIANSTNSTQAVYGMITQPAYRDSFVVGGGAPIILTQQQYRVRVTALSTGTPTGSPPTLSGNLVVDLFSPSTGTQFPGFSSIPLAQMTSSMLIFDETLLTTIFTPIVPSDLQIRIYATDLSAGAKIYVDRIEPYLTAQPLIDGGTSFLCSYANNFEAFDINTGRLGMATENQQPLRCAFTLFDQLVGVKSRSMYSTTDNGTTEPGLWTVREISNQVGTPSVNGVAIGEGWAVVADQAGLFLWDGGQPVKISGEIQPIWDAINWNYGHTIWVTNDVTKKRICIGVPLVTPNVWMPDFPANANPTSPNVVLMLSYRELNSASALASEGAIRQTFMGTLKAYQLGRKWAAWNIISTYAAFCDRPDHTRQLLFCNGVENSKIYQQLPGNFSDDGEAIFSRYMTYGIPKSDEAEAKQLGLHRYVATFATFLVEGNGDFAVSTYPDFPTSPRVAVSTPQQLLNPPPYGDLELPLNRSGFRFFMDLSTNEVNSWFKLSRLNLTLSKEPYSTTRGGNF